MISLGASVFAWFKLSKYGPITIAAVLAVLGVVGIYRAGKGVGENDTLRKQQGDFIARTDAGRKAGREAERDSATMTGDERLSAVRDNDGAWE